MPDIEPRILVLGIGNVLMLDEGIGNRVAVELEKNYSFPDDVRIMDAGTMGLGMMHLFRGVEFMLVVDAMDGSGHPPGTVVRIAPEDFAPNQVMHSLHDIRFVDVLEAAKLIGLMPEADCIGIQVQDMSPAEITIGLSEPVEAAVPRAVAAVLYVLEERGVQVQPLESPDADDAFRETVAEAKADIARRQAERAAAGTPTTGEARS
ncbi:MAG TPA: hydrogenase maturation protease [Actinobacteria bacterium]|nr:hydrogenase maturation protease [Actinomycetota bacterium]